MTLNFMKLVLLSVIPMKMLLFGFVEAQTLDINDRLAKTTNLRQHLQDSFSNIRNDANNQEKTRVKSVIENNFNALRAGLPSDRAGMVVVNSHDYDFTDPRTSRRFLGKNILLTIKGTRYGTADDRILLVGSHFDTVAISPGVEDNGSGMAALLEIARILVEGVASQADGRCSFTNTIIVVALDHEEDGFIGTQAYLTGPFRTLVESSSNSNAQGAYVLDMIMNFDGTANSQKVPTGFNLVFPTEYQLIQQRNFVGDFMMTIARQDDKGIAGQFATEWYNIVGGQDYSTTTAKYRQIGLTLPITGNPGKHPLFQNFLNFYRSDHFAFWSTEHPLYPTGISAIHITDSGDFRGDLVTCYHQACDNFARVTDERIEFLQIGTEAVMRSLVALSTEKNSSCIYAVASTGPGVTMNFATKPELNFVLIIATVMILVIQSW